MKSNFIIFFSIVLVFYAAINYYIFRRSIQAIPTQWNINIFYTIIFVFISSSYIIGRFLERVWMSTLTDVLSWIGAFWLGAMVYFFLAILIIDIIRLFNHFLPFFPQFITANYAKTKMYLLIGVTMIVFITIISGFINAMIPRIVNLDFPVNKTAGNLKELKIAVVSDIHLGTMMTKSRFDGIVMKINALNPDIILLAGDILDEDLAPVIRRNLGDGLKSLKSKYGTYAITGNHEYIGGAEKAVIYLTEHNVHVLRDTFTLIDNSFYLVGREDRSKSGFSGSRRKEIPELVAGVDFTKPVIFMDHQPFNLEKAAEAGADIQFSGHTHHGQMFPFNFITKKVYEVSWGYKKKLNTHFYVSSGLGTWGPPIKIGNVPEILNVNVSFK